MLSTLRKPLNVLESDETQVIDLKSVTPSNRDVIPAKAGIQWNPAHPELVEGFIKELLNGSTGSP